MIHVPLFLVVPLAAIVIGAMMGAVYPGAKVHRVSRRHLGRGQSAQQANGVTCVLTNPSADVITMTFNKQVTVSGIIPLTSSTGAFVSQTVTSSTVVTQTWSVSQAAATVTLPGNAANVASYQGGGVVGTSVTF
jgi:hypothetical protein